MHLNSKNFFVEEILENGDILELDKPYFRKDNGEKFLYIVLQKENFTTIGLLKKIAKHLHISYKRFSFAGNKDKNATTIQLISIFKMRKENFKINIKNVKILGMWYENKKLELGSLLGNRFTVILNEKKEPNLKKEFPNFFGPQRFGSRKNNQLIGEYLVKNQLRKATHEFLFGSSEEEYRIKLKETLDYKEALHYFPRHLFYERSILHHLSSFPNDFAGALRKLPRQLLLMFVHSFQSHLFNEMLKHRIRNNMLYKMDGEFYCGSYLGFPDIKKKGNDWLVGKIIGYETEVNDFEKDFLEKYDITKDYFKIKSLPEISSKGNFRPLFVPAKDLSFKNNVLKFSLPSSSYATIYLKEVGL